VERPVTLEVGGAWIKGSGWRHLLPDQKGLLKIAAAVFSETMENFQHATHLIPGNRVKIYCLFISYSAGALPS
jgi:hypothetical protein